MITRIVKVKIKPTSIDAFNKFKTGFLNEVRTFKNCHHADCFADLDEKYQYHIYTIWHTQGALNKFRKSDINIEFKEKLTGWGEAPFTAWTVENI